MTPDWQQAWFAPLRELMVALPAGPAVADRLNQLGHAAPHFVASLELPAGEAQQRQLV